MNHRCMNVRSQVGRRWVKAEGEISGWHVVVVGVAGCLRSPHVQGGGFRDAVRCSRGFVVFFVEGGGVHDHDSSETRVEI